MPARPAILCLALLLAPTLSAATMGPALAHGPGRILHEPIRPDPREDLAYGATLEGDLPVALQTASGLVAAPDLRALPEPVESTYGPNKDDTFAPDRDTRRPEMSNYHEPFAPATAPFKRLHAYDAVGADYQLRVRNEQRVEVPTNGPPPGPSEDAFYADLVVEVGRDRTARIPSVGPGARVVHARLALGPEELPARLASDGAENWFLRASTTRGRVRARLVMELAIAHAALGGELGDPSWSDLPRVSPLPSNVARDAAIVRSAIGVGHGMRPREAIVKLASYFRSFAESSDSPSGRGSIYLDLALSKKGVCRHRAFAFLVTAQSLGIPARVVTNEAHAWVEVHDGALWRRIDLGGAAPFAPVTSRASGERAAYQGPPESAASAQSTQSAADRGGDHSTQEEAPSASPSHDERRPSQVSLAVLGVDAHRGQPLRVRGEVRSGTEPCPHVGVDLWLRPATGQNEVFLGRLATGDDGVFVDEIVVSSGTPLGEYDVVARTVGDARCGPGSSD